jgi:hypothetical protein
VLEEELEGGVEDLRAAAFGPEVGGAPALDARALRRRSRGATRFLLGVWRSPCFRHSYSA